MNMRALTGTDDLPRRTFTVKDVERMGEVGLIREDERIELIGGELIPMNAKGSRHETFKLAMTLRWGKSCPPGSGFITETTFRLSPDTFLDPDFLIFDRATGIRGLNAATAQLAVEISDSSRGYGLGPKALVYAHFGIRELWVIDTMTMRFIVHREPENGRYGAITPWHVDDLVVPAFAPIEFALRLSDLAIDE